jgi:hypothetical protein
MLRITTSALAVIACLGLPLAGFAQNPQPAPPQETHPRVAPPNAPSPPPEQIAPGGTPTGKPGDDTLSDKLSRQKGTLTPPAVDPGIRAPLPSHSQGTMPVIPPPGTPGGDPQVTPK